MQNKINDLLDLHNDMWITLHRLKRANAEFKLLQNGAAGELADSEAEVHKFSELYTEQLMSLKSLTETI